MDLNEAGALFFVFMLHSAVIPYRYLLSVVRCLEY
jgi:hypothetical protein